MGNLFGHSIFPRDDDSRIRLLGFKWNIFLNKNNTINTQARKQCHCKNGREESVDPRRNGRNSEVWTFFFSEVTEKTEFGSLASFSLFLIAATFHEVFFCKKVPASNLGHNRVTLNRQDQISVFPIIVAGDVKSSRPNFSVFRETH